MLDRYAARPSDFEFIGLRVHKMFRQKNTLRIGFSVLLTWTLIALAPLNAMAQDDDAARTIHALRMQSNEAIARHDTEGIGSFLDEDFVISISVGFIERSKEEHLRSFEQHFAEYPDVIYERTPSSITKSEAFPLAVEQGTWVGTRTTKNVRLEIGGPYTAAWRLTDDGWKIYSELFVALYCHGVDC